MRKMALGNLKKRERALVIIALLVFVSLMANKFLIAPTLRTFSKVDEKYDSKNILLKKYYEYISNEKWYSEKLHELEDEYEVMEGKILAFETEELASAKLQELTKNIAKRNGLTISRSIAAKKKVINDDPYLVAISANFEINDIDQLKKLRTFIYDVEYNKDKLFFVDDIKVKGIGLDKTDGVSISTTVAAIAAIKKR